MCAHIKHARLNYKSAVRELTIQIQEQVQVKWSANLHLKILTLYDEITHFIKEVKTGITGGEANAGIDKETKPLNWALRIKGDVQLLITISSKHEMVMVATDLIAGRMPEYVGIETVLLKISIDNADIFSFEDCRICRVKDDVKVREERSRSEGFVLDNNKIW